MTPPRLPEKQSQRANNTQVGKQFTTGFDKYPILFYSEMIEYQFNWKLLLSKEFIITPNPDQHVSQTEESIKLGIKHTEQLKSLF